MGSNRFRSITFFCFIVLLWLYLLYNNAWIGLVVISLVLALSIYMILSPNVVVHSGNYSNINGIPQDFLIYYGNELDFTNADIITVLSRHFPYYNSLNIPGKQKFIDRLNKFIKSKIFKIHNCKGFREMPILISASAIQLSFGLSKYLLPHFTYINIYPEEFLAIRETICFLEGNVGGHSINISWKHFLEGFQLPMDGANVGLHEMAHAYYFQSFGPCLNKDEDFMKGFNNFNICGNKVYCELAESNLGLYSDYASKNFQEFWAESVELFFEKPIEFQSTYPVLYNTLQTLLQQHSQQTIIE